MAHAVECFYMGPNDTTVPEQVEYALGSRLADAVIVAGAFLGDDGVKETELRQRMMSGYYKLSNRTTNDTGILMIQEMIDKANEEIDSMSAATAADFCGGSGQTSQLRRASVPPLVAAGGSAPLSAASAMMILHSTSERKFRRSTHVGRVDSLSAVKACVSR